MVNSESLQRIIMNIEQLGTPNPVALKLIEKASVDFEVDEMASILSCDSSVAALILKTANSVHFSRGQRIKTIKQAIVHLGKDNISKLLFAVDMIEVFKGDSLQGSNHFSEPDFWMHTLAGAVLASKYAVLKNSCNPDITYVASLMRDIGILAIRQFTPDEFEELLAMQNTYISPFDTYCKTILGISHRKIAFKIGVRWGLPASIVESIRDELPSYPVDDEVREIREAILFADELLHLTKYCVWDRYYCPGKFDFKEIPCEEMFNSTKDMVAGMMHQFWN